MQFLKFYGQLLLLVLIISLPSFAFSQFHSIKVYSALDHPSISNLTDILIDKKGFIWVGTYAHGVIKFDGNQFQNYSAKDGLASNQAIQIIEDKEGRIWTGSAERGFSIIRKPKFKNFRTGNYKVEYFNYVVFDPRVQNVVFGSSTAGLLKYDEKLDTLIQIDFPKHEKSVISYVRYTNQDFTKFVFQSSDSIFILNKNKINFHCKIINDYSHLFGFILGNTFFYNHKNEIKSNCLENCKSKTAQLHVKCPGLITYFGIKGNEVILAYSKSKEIQVIQIFNKNLLLLKEYTIKHHYAIEKVLIDKAGNLWGMCAQNFVKVLTQMKEFVNNESFMPPNITSILMDSNSNVWFSSAKDGMAYYNGHQIIPCTQINQQFKAFLDCSFLDSKGQVNFNVSGPKPGILVVKSPNKFKLINKGHLSFFTTKNRKGQIVLGMGNNEGIWISKSDPIVDTPNNFIKIGVDKGLKFLNVLTVCEDNNDNLWFGRLSQGIGVYDKAHDTIMSYMKQDSFFIPGSLCMTNDYYGNIWIGTDNGVYFAKADNWSIKNTNLDQILKHISPDIIGTSLVGCIKVKDSTLYVGNSTGLYLLDLKSYYNDKISIQSLNNDYGYSGGAVSQNSFYFDDNRKELWLAGSEKVVCFEYNKYIVDTVVPILAIDYVQVLDKKIDYNFEFLELDAGASAFFIQTYVDNINYIYPNLTYHYKVDHFEWIFNSNKSKLELINLRPGKHKVQIKAVKNGNIESVPIEMVFTIKSFWWESKWLWWIIGGSMVFSLFYIYIKQLEVNKQKVSLLNLEYEKLVAKKERSNLQIQAIISQLNPHFIKNVLSWVQIRTSSDKIVTRIIGKLSQNIKLVFDNTKEGKPYHKLENEMLLVKNYMFIQKERFFPKLDYILPDPESLMPFLKYDVPLMCLQSHFENACEHGVKHLINKVGIIKLILEEEPNYLHFIIEDNGVGREQAKILRSSGTQRGVKMLEELIEIFNEKNELNLELWYDDNIFQENGVQFGTRVHVKIPKNYNFNIE
ncbi:MAG: histidine kinase [Saprospiraceae bacterium]|nr:histidine kinase [Saprospiraceae bacterium]